MIVITEDHIEQLRTPAGGFNMRSMEIIGNWPLVEGWRERLVGARIADRQWKQAVKAAQEKRHVFRGNTRRK